MKKKVTYIVSDIDKALAFEWVATYLNKDLFIISFILLNNANSNLEEFLKSQNIPVARIKLGRNGGLASTFFKLWWILLWSRPHIAHTHLRFGSMLGITAAFLAGIKMRIHTRHHAAFHHLYHPHAVKVDKLVSRLSTHIVSISDVVTDTLVFWEGTDPKKIYKIPHGFDLNLFTDFDQVQVDFLRNKYIPHVTGPVIGMISRFIELKGHLYVIAAFEQLLQTKPNAHLILANANGEYEERIKEKLSSLPNNTYTLIQFEPNVASLYQLFDVYVHVPIDSHVEAFGQTYVEAVAASIPSVFTLSGIAREFIKNKHNALVVDFKNAPQIEKAILDILGDKDLQKSLIENGKASVQPFNLATFISRLESLYNG